MVKKEKSDLSISSNMNLDQYKTGVLYKTLNNIY